MPTGHENIALTILAVLVGLGLLYFLLEKLVKIKADDKISGLKDYFLIFKQSLIIIKDNKWMFWIPMGIILISSLMSPMVMRVNAPGSENISAYSVEGGIGWFRFSAESELDKLISSFDTVGLIKNITSIWAFWVLPEGDLFTLIIAFTLIFGYFGFKKLIEAAKQNRGANIFQAIHVPVTIFCILAISAYVLFYNSLSSANAGLILILFSIPTLLLGNLFLAFFSTGVTLKAYLSHSSKQNKLPLNTREVFDVAKKLFYFFLIMGICTYPLWLLYYWPFININSEIFHYQSYELFRNSYYILLGVVGLAFLFVPLSIVVKKKGVIQAIQENFKFWKREYLRIMVFVVMFATLSVVVNFLEQILIYSLDSLKGYFVGLAIAAVGLYFGLLLVVSLTGFYCKLAGSEEK